MSKIITSPVKRWPGTVTLSDPLNYPQAMAVEEALDEAALLDEEVSRNRRSFVLLPAFLMCVESWDLEGFPEQVTAETFPATPAVVSANLLSWLIGEVTVLFAEADESPNE